MKVTVALRGDPMNVTRVYPDANNVCVVDGLLRVECGFQPASAGALWLEPRDVHLFALTAIVECHQENGDAAKIFKPEAGQAKCDGSHAFPYCQDPECWQYFKEV